VITISIEWLSVYLFIGLFTLLLCKQAEQEANTTLHWFLGVALITQWPIVWLWSACVLFGEVWKTGGSRWRF
jgi:hypothetical protein